MTKQNAYDARVRRISEILVDQFYNHSPGEIWYENRIKEADKSACAMVAEMAKEYECAYFSNYPGTEDSEDYVLWNQNCISEMQERGLIQLI